jgi:hypothetical protein
MPVATKCLSLQLDNSSMQLVAVVVSCHDTAPAAAAAAGDTKRLQALEMQMHGSCSAPSGFAFMSLPGLC